MLLIRAMIIALIFWHPLSYSQPPPDCLVNQTCGNLKVRYPFRLTSRLDCPSFSRDFDLDCNNSSGGQLLLYFSNVTATKLTPPLQLKEISMDDSSLIADVTSFRSALSLAEDNITCYEGLNSRNSYLEFPPFPSPYFISDDNVLKSFGCSIIAMLLTSELSDISNVSASDIFNVSGCYESCQQVGGTCVSGMHPGTFPRMAYYLITNVTTINTSQSVNSSCSSNYATLLHPDYAVDFDGLKLKWALPSNETSTFGNACAPHSNVTPVPELRGYLCSCKLGYTGDGYSNGSGCSDVNECESPNSNDCFPGITKCRNSQGSYTCKCNSWFDVGDGRRNGTGCIFSPLLTKIFVSTCGILGFGLLMGGFVFLARWWRKRTKRKYFMQNGGLQLQAYIAAGARETTRLFSAGELKAATNSYSDEMKLGEGGFGTVFKGNLEDGTVVAIKKANRAGGDKQFLNEMAILTQINHRHIVRMIGCCLETPVPLLVYEYVSNGNVAENLESGVMGWGQRLKVATQTAEALAYLHAAASPPILHRDVKSANILLDYNLDAKVADFGVSRLLPEGVQQVSTAVQGTIGYLDPEYFQTLQLTDKSDVYSLGVMLVELITSLKPVDNRNREPRFANLALLFVDHMREGTWDELIDPRLDNPSTRSSIMAVATLAHRCLALHGATRPSMSDVADELHRITRSLQGAEEDDEEALPLLPSKEKYIDYEAGAVVVAQNALYHAVGSGYNSMSIAIENQLTMPR